MASTTTRRRRTARQPKSAEPPAASPRLAEPAQPPTPTGYLAEWWPASVRIPGGESLRRAKVYLTRQGAYIYTARPTDPTAPPDLHVPIDFDKTRKPVTEYAARVNGVQLHATDGRVLVVRKLSGCGCHHPLKTFRPAWARHAEPWE